MAWIHRIHTAGGASSSITMVVVFVGCLCSCGWTRDVTSSSYVKNGTKNNLKMRLMVLLFDPRRRAPHIMVVTMESSHEVILTVDSMQTNDTHFEVCQRLVVLRNNKCYKGLNDCRCLVVNLFERFIHCQLLWVLSHYPAMTLINPMMITYRWERFLYIVYHSFGNIPWWTGENTH